MRHLRYSEDRNSRRTTETGPQAGRHFTSGGGGSPSSGPHRVAGRDEESPCLLGASDRRTPALYVPAWRCALGVGGHGLEHALHTGGVRIRTLVSDELVDCGEEPGPLGCVESDTILFQDPFGGLDRDRTIFLSRTDAVDRCGVAVLRVGGVSVRPRSADRQRKALRNRPPNRFMPPLAGQKTSPAATAT